MARHILLPLFVALALLGCASLAARDPLEVAVAGIEPMPDKGEGLELRLLVRLRVQNPNPDAISYGGAFVKVEVQDRTFATGVTDVGGAIPGFGEAVVEVPVTVSMLRMVRQVIGMQDAAQADQIRYSMSGKLGSHRFSVSGEFSLQPKPQADPAAAT
jgi:LEA14-like dessication related protein